MFIQVIQGKTSDAEALRQQFDRWKEEVAQGAEGYLGSTAGVAEDGTFVALARFESEEAARANSDRPEQGSWWEETSRHFDGEVTFRDCTEVYLHHGGGSDKAGFVQVIQGRATDKERLQAMDEEFLPQIIELRTEILGAVDAWDGDHVTSAVYFASEHTAREGEGQVLPGELQESFNEWQSLMEDLTYIDLKDPWLHTDGD
ncbi:MAG TPA: hypothetical protein VHE80_00410 [Acidimicrobiales bacterium]|nr:hypothetical protein [Acidimicrobiales bacterium]